MSEKQRNYTNMQGGQAIAIAIVFFLIISVSVVAGIAAPVLCDTQIGRTLERSKDTYFLAEALVEDVTYRLRQGMDVSGTETLLLAGNTATADVTDISGGKSVVSTGDISDAVRRIQVNLVVGTGVAFNFGVQTGVGGFIMDNNAGVIGNVYSNGNIIGGSGSYVTGSAITAGSSGLIDGVDVGTEPEDEAWSNQVTDSTLFGKLYCQIGSGNNKSCDTSRPDAEPAEFPITDEQINGWKATAEGGAFILGNYSVPANSTIILGPAKITGNMSFGNGATLRLTGPVWVEGTITTGNNSIVDLGLEYESGSEVLLTDSTISLSNNTEFRGSGEEGSYILLLTTVDSENAINVNNNAGTVILNAQNGRINFSNNSGANQATAETIFLNNNAVVTYETGLIDVNFNSGPSGGYNIELWEEVE